MASQDDIHHMRRAIALARTRLGVTGGNPSVGCVIAKDGEIVGQGATAEGGRPHAEEQALAVAGTLARGATAYVTLEPCAERTSGEASCAERLATAGVARVLVACKDPSLKASGRGIERLRAAGVEVQGDVAAEEAAPLYVQYVQHLATSSSSG